MSLEVKSAWTVAIDKDQNTLLLTGKKGESWIEVAVTERHRGPGQSNIQAVIRLPIEHFRALVDHPTVLKNGES